MSYSKTILLGNLGKDPEVREFDGGKVVSFTLATTERGYTKQNGTQVPEHTDWHNCVCFGKTADFVASYVRKGSKVFVEGKIRYRSYQDQNGATKWVTEIIVDRLDNLTPKSDNQGYQQSQVGYPQSQQPQGYGRDPLQDFAAPPPTAKEIPGYNPPDGLF